MTRKRICENWQASVNSGAHAALYVIYEREIAHGPRHDRIRLALVIYISTTTSIHRYGGTYPSKSHVGAARTARYACVIWMVSDVSSIFAPNGLTQNDHTSHFLC